MTDTQKSSVQNEISTYLEYAHLQIAAEAFIDNTRGKTFHIPDNKEVKEVKPKDLADDLIKGNWHSSKFSKTLADEFVKRWKVVRHIGNTGTGFSGTLFEAIADNPAAGIKKGQQVLSFRSTEFVDDALRDSRATNELEIKEKGFAFGQISDMKEWIDELRRDGAMKDHITVTGYSLGGHLATALYQLQSEGTFAGLNIVNTYTFNGAGIGKLLDGAQLKTAIEKFLHYRKAGAAELFTTKEAIDLYNEIKEIYDDESKELADRISLIKRKVNKTYMSVKEQHEQVSINDPAYKAGLKKREEIEYLIEAVKRLDSINNERLRIRDFTSGKLDKNSKETKLLSTEEKDIDGLSLDYQIGVIISSKKYTEAYPKFLGVGSGLVRVIMNNKLIEGEKEGKDNFYDIIGKTYTSMVAVSQKHFGKDIRISIEDQPLGRGYFVTNMLKESILDYKDDTPDLKLLVDKYDINAFGDTHSLVLIVDSLLAHNTLLQLDNNFTIDTFDKIMPLLSNVEADTDIANKNQGVAEGDALENLVNHLIKIFNIKINDNRLIDISPDRLKGLRSDLRGGTWNKVENVVHDDKVYHGREALHSAIKEIENFINTHGLNNAFSLESSKDALSGDGVTDLDKKLMVRSREDFNFLLALKTLSPFVLSPKENNNSIIWKKIQNEMYTKWEEDNAYINNGGIGINFSDNWIKDRITLLRLKNVEYANNIDVSKGIWLPPDINKRIEGVYMKSLDDNIGVASINRKRGSIQFGSDDKEKEDDLQGNEYIDRLYAGKGNDKLQGGGGADYMEGGEGHDTYIADKEDTILDSDGKGEVHLDGNLIKGKASRIKDKNDENDNGAGTYKDERGNSFAWGGQIKIEGTDLIVGSDLIINGGLTIKNFRNGDLGIHLENQKPPSEPPPTSPPIKDPLSLDLDGDGEVKTLPRSAGVHFDLDNSGFAEQTSWLAPSDGFLVLDRNNNGHIDGGAELFGSETTLNNGKVAKNGFEALAEWDGNADGKINAEDAIYHRLRIWQDKNSNGIVNSGELNTLQAHGIAEIRLDYKESFYRDWNKVSHREIGHFTRADGTISEVHTLWFDSNTIHSVPVDIQQGRDIEISTDIATLPDAKGFGNIYSLHHAMALDTSGTLQKLVTQFVQEKDPAARHALTDKIMARWAGKEDIAPGSRGELVDAGHLALLEAFWGSVEDKDNPSGWRADWLNTAYGQLHNMVYRQLASQTHYRELYNLVDFYKTGNTWYANIGGVNRQLLQAFADGTMTAEDVRDFLINTVGGSVTNNEDLLNGIKQSIVNDAQVLADAQKSILLAAVMRDDDVITGNDKDNYIATYAGDDEIKGMAGNDTIDAGSGNDKVYGGTGDDELYGGDGDDHIEGGEGNDMVNGGNGNDYIEDTNDNGDDVFDGGAGDDEIISYGGNDTLIGGEGNDSLSGGYLISVKHNIINGGPGNDNLTTGIGSNTFIFGQNFGKDYISYRLIDPYFYTKPAQSVNTIQFEDDWKVSDFTFRRHYGRLIISSKQGNNSITIDHQFTDYDFSPSGKHPQYHIDRITFSDGTVLDHAAIAKLIQQSSEGDDELYAGEGGKVLSGMVGNDKLHGTVGADMLDGGAGDDTLEGYGGDDNLDGGEGNDTLDGGLGVDTYLFQGDWGKDYIIDGTEHNGQSGNRVRFLDCTLNELRFSRKDGRNLLVRKLGTENEILIRRQFSDKDVLDACSITQWEFADGRVLTPAEINKLLHQGTDGNDEIRGDDTDNIMAGWAGNDTLHGYDGNDEMDGGDGDDYLYGDSGDDQLYGGNGNDKLHGFNDNDVLNGGSGNDELYGDNGNDIINGGSGNDKIDGGRGDDVFVFTKGWGQDSISQPWGADVIRFTDVMPDEISVSQQGYDIILTRKDSDDSIHISLQLDKKVGSISKVIFADGSEWDTEKLLTLSLSSTENADIIKTYYPDVTIYGGDGNDVIEAKNGKNNRLYGDAGNDIINGKGELYGGDGYDSLFGMGKLYGESGNDSLLGDGELYGGDGDDYLAGSYALYGGDGDDSLYLHDLYFQGKGPENTRLLHGDGGDGDDDLYVNREPKNDAYKDGAGIVAPSRGEATVILRGGRGNDRIQGSYDNEVYEFSLGDGHDVILEHTEASELYHSNIKASWDVLRFGSGIKAEDIRYLRQDRDLLISHKNGTDSITVQNFFYTENAAYHHYRINEVQFADGTVHTDSDIDRFVTQGSSESNRNNAANVALFTKEQYESTASSAIPTDAIDQIAVHYAQNLVQAMSTFDQRSINANNLISPNDSNLVNKIPLAPSF